MLLLTLYLPSKVLLVKVAGNHIVSSEMILDAASSGGIYFGASRQRIRSEKVKNILLSKIPQLQWAGINTYGCIAEISVLEKKQPVQMSARCGVTSIVAARDGVITSMHVSSGMPMCKPGQAVKSGEVLVSGYIDCGICVYGTTANGEIYADTMQRISAKIPNNYSEKVSILPLAKKYTLILGKKRINLYKGSGISGATCGKMYEEHYWSLPGGIQLPLGFIEETWSMPENLQSVVFSEERTKPILEMFSKNYIEENMLAGTVISSNQDFIRLEDVDILSSRLLCNEMIGRVRIEEMVNLYEEDN
jgi:sporulation protein YqfD